MSAQYNITDLSETFHGQSRKQTELSIRAYRGHLTREIAQAKSLVDLAEKRPTTKLASQIEELKWKINRKADEINWG